MSKAKMSDHFGFGVERDGEAVTFTTRGAGTGPMFWFGIVVLAPVVGFLGALLSKSVGGFVLGAGIVLLVALSMDLRRRGRSVFRVSPAGFEKGGNRYEMARVTEILWGSKAGTMQSASGSTVVVGGTGMIGVAAVGAALTSQVFNDLGNGMRGSLAKRGHHVSIRYGRHVVPLANHLTEDVAQSLFHEVNAVLGGA